MDGDTGEEQTSTPPHDLDTLLAWVDQLKQLDSTQREHRLRALRAEPGGSASARLLAHLTGPGVIQAVEVADRWAKVDKRDADAVDLLVRLCERGDVTAGWSDWEDIEDRSEVRLRLQAIGRAPPGTIDASLTPFVLFFFRASDPELYRWAALALGRHWHELEEARSHVRQWCQPRGLALSRAPSLDGTRSPRRLLFLQAGLHTREAGPGDEDPIGQPEDTLEAVLGLSAGELSVPDLTAALRVANILTEAEDRMLAPSIGLLERAQTVPRGDLDRNLLGAWSQLFAACRPRASPSEADRLEQVLQRLAMQALGDLRSADAFGEIVAALDTLDHLVRSYIPLPEQQAQRCASLLTERSQGLETRWLQMRTRTWVSRESDAEAIDLEAFPGPRDTTHGQLPDPVQAIMEHTWPPVEQGAFTEPRIEAALALLDGLLDLFTSEREWKSHDPHLRALALSAVFDLLRNEQLPGERLAALLDRHEVVLGDPRVVEGDRAQRRSALARVLARVVDWEEAGLDPLLEAQTIHEVDDTLLLLGFVPTHRNPSWLGSLADAIEHRFRWLLRREASFRPVGFLARLTIREPHPRLYEALARISEGRSYPVPGHEQGFPLAEVAKDLAHQARAARGDAPLEEVLEAWDPARLAAWDPLAGDLASLREALLGLDEASDAPGRGARLFADVVGRADPRGRATGHTVLGLLASLHAPDRPVPRPGDPPWTRDTLETYLNVASGEAADVAVLADRLDTDIDVHEMRAALEQLRSSLTRTVDALVDGLPLAETRLLQARSRSIGEANAGWIDALGAIEDAHDRALDGDEEAWTSLLADVSQRWSGPALTGVLLRIWSSLLEPRRPAQTAMDPNETWKRRARLVGWAATSSVREEWETEHQAAWDEELARAYETLLVEVMEANREDWVLELLEEPAYQRPRSAPILEDTLQQARDWCRDRYRLHGSLSARRALTRQRGEPPPGVVGEAGSLLVHFSPVWSALLVGAIFLLDFGDAWVELAEAGDVTGIVLTCLIGGLGAYMYVVRDLRSKIAPKPGESAGSLFTRLLGRSAAFTLVCILVATVITSFLWWMLRSTDAVVRGPWAIANVAVWTGFALFVGIVFGLVIQKGI